MSRTAARCFAEGAPARVYRRRTANITAHRLIEAFFAGRNARTLRAYRADLDAFRDFLGAARIEDAVEVLLSCNQGELNALGLGYRADGLAHGLSPATVNRRLAVLRSLIKRARVLGMISWTMDIPNVKSQPYRDTRGPGREGFNRLLRVVEKRVDRRGRRDRAALRLLFDLALRRHEVVSLDVDDVDLEFGTVSVLGKGRTEHTRLTLPDVTRAALAAWLEARGEEPGPLFINFDRARKGHRLTGRSLYRIVCALGRSAGIRTTPHGLRHAAITEALDLTNGDVRAVQRFSRHRDLRVLNIYDDSREDLGGRVAQMVASGSPR